MSPYHLQNPSEVDLVISAAGPRSTLLGITGNRRLLDPVIFLNQGLNLTLGIKLLLNPLVCLTLIQLFQGLQHPLPWLSPEKPRAEQTTGDPVSNPPPDPQPQTVDLQGEAIRRYLMGPPKNFRLESQKIIPEAGGALYLFVHIPTGGQVVYLLNRDPKITFMQGFKTPPTSNDGITHILEHCALCGSRKFPLGNLTLELNRLVPGYTNATTWSDRTIYTASSHYVEALKIQMEAFLDAVFFPHVKKNFLIFEREGWAYELQGEGETQRLLRNGVVLNEMKGAAADPSEMIYGAVKKHILAGTPYAFNFGGDPKTIPHSHPKHLINYHSEHYHPSNGIAVFIGRGEERESSDIHVQSLFTLLDSFYSLFLSDAPFTPSLHPRKRPSPLSPPLKYPQEIFESYPAQRGVLPEGNTYLTLTTRFKPNGGKKFDLILQILHEILLGTPHSPLNRALLPLGSLVSGHWFRDYPQPFYSIWVSGSSPGQDFHFRSTVYRVLDQMVRQGIPKESIHAAIQRVEFSVNESYMNPSRGILLGHEIISSLLQDKSIEDSLSFRNSLAEIKALALKGFFENFIQEQFLKNPERLTLVLKPDSGGLERKAAQEEALLSQTLARMSPRDRWRLRRRIQNRQDQNHPNPSKPSLPLEADSPDPEEVQNPIPLLPLSLLDLHSEALHRVSSETQGLPLIFHDISEVDPLAPRDLLHIQFHFDMGHLDPEDLPYLGLLLKLLGKFPTAHFPEPQKLVRTRDLHLGEMNFFPDFSLHKKVPGDFTPLATIEAKLLPSEEHLKVLFYLLEEILLKTQFTKDLNLLKRQVLERALAQNGGLQNRATSYVILRSLASVSQHALFLEKIQGLSYDLFIQNLGIQLRTPKPKNQSQTLPPGETSSAETLGVALQNLSQKLFKQGHLWISITSSKETLATLRSHLDPFVRHHFSENPKVPSPPRSWGSLLSKRVGIEVGGPVQYTALATLLPSPPKERENLLLTLAASLISSGFLWNEVRVKGGAYNVSAFSHLLIPGLLVMTSSQDPQLRRTKEAFRQTSQFLKSLENNPSTRGLIQGLLLRLLSDTKNWSLQKRIKTDDLLQLGGWTHEDIVAMKKSLLEPETTIPALIEKLRNLGPRLEEALNQGGFAVAGPDHELRNHLDLLETIIPARPWAPEDCSQSLEPPPSNLTNGIKSIK